MKYLEVTQLRERVQKDAKDDVEANNCDEDEEGQMEQGLDAKVVEGPFALEHLHFLGVRKWQNRAVNASA